MDHTHTRLCLEHTNQVPSYIKGWIETTVQSCTSTQPATQPKNGRGYPQLRIAQGNKGTKPFNTKLPPKETSHHLPSCHCTSKDVHLHMQVHKRQVCSICQCSNQYKDSILLHQNEGANYAAMTIKYGTLPEKASTATYGHKHLHTE